MAPPAELRVEEPGCGIQGHPEPEVHREHPRLPYRPIGDHAPQTVHQRKEPRPHALHQEQAPPARDPNDPPSLGGVDGEGLLAEHAFSRQEAEFDVLRVERVGRGDVDDIHVRVGGEFLVARVRTGEAVGFGETVGGVLRAGPDGQRLRIRQGGEGFCKPGGDGARPDDPPSDPAHGWLRWRVIRAEVPNCLCLLPGVIYPPNPIPEFTVQAAMLHTSSHRIKWEKLRRKTFRC